jgi:hypothetical protein
MSIGKFFKDMTSHNSKIRLALNTVNVHVSKAMNKLFDLSDPFVGDQIIKLQRPTLLIRVHGSRPINTLFDRDGFHPRIPTAAIPSVRYSRVEQYQKYNEDPFAWGACATAKDLRVFMDVNKGHTDTKWIYKFYGHSTSLLSLKLNAGIEVHGHDNELEEIFINHIPFSQFIAATCPKYRDKFLAGDLVPNEMHAYNQSLPKQLCFSDLESEDAVLKWLLNNDSKETFAKVSTYLYGNVCQNSLDRRLGDSSLADSVRSVLDTGSSLKP